MAVSVAQLTMPPRLNSRLQLFEPVKDNANLSGRAGEIKESVIAVEALDAAAPPSIRNPIPSSEWKPKCLRDRLDSFYRTEEPNIVP